MSIRVENDSILIFEINFELILRFFGVNRSLLSVLDLKTCYVDKRSGTGFLSLLVNFGHFRPFLDGLVSFLIRSMII